MNTYEQSCYEQNTINFIERTFSAHQGVMFVIETNKMLRKDLELLQSRLNESEYNNTLLFRELRDASNLLKAVEISKDAKQLADILANFKSQKQKWIRLQKELESRITKLKDSYDFVISRHAQLQLRLKAANF